MGSTPSLEVNLSRIVGKIFVDGLAPEKFFSYCHYNSSIATPLPWRGLRRMCKSLVPCIYLVGTLGRNRTCNCSLGENRDIRFTTRIRYNRLIAAILFLNYHSSLPQPEHIGRNFPCSVCVAGSITVVRRFRSHTVSAPVANFLSCLR